MPDYEEVVAGDFVGTMVFVSFWLYERCRILPIGKPDASHRVSVLSAAARECSLAQNSARAIILQAVPDFDTVTINQETVNINSLEERLSDILRTRPERTVYLMDNSATDDNASGALEKRVEQLPVLDLICIINPKNPPAWYPPKQKLYPAGGGAGTKKAVIR